MRPSANIGAFNLGNALGAAVGGITITAGLGYTSPIWAGALITLVALVVLIGAALAARRNATGPGASTAAPQSAPALLDA